MGKQKKNELDAILEQLKKSYAADVDNELEDSLLEEEKSEEDTELASVLEKIFASDSDNDSDEDSIGADSDDIDQIDQKENSVSEGLVTDDGSITENEEFDSIASDVELVESLDIVSENDVACESCEPDAELNDNSKEEERVDDVLSMMFHRDSDTVENEACEIIETNDTAHVESDLDDDFCEDAPEETQCDEVEYSAETEELIDESNIEAAASLLVSFDEKSDNDYVTDGDADISADEITDEADALLIDETDSIECEISENDSEQEIIVDNVVCDSEEEIIAEDIAEEEIIQVKKIVLDPMEYTKDFLQCSVDGLSLFKPEEDIDESIFREESSNDEEPESNADRVTPVAPQADIKENDVSLLMKFGYGGEVASSVGSEYAHAVAVEKNNEYVPHKHQIVHGFVNKEFSSTVQIPQIAKKYKMDKIFMLISSMVLSLIAIAMLVTDILVARSVTSDDYLSLIAFELILTIIIAAILHKRLYYGLLAISRFETSNYSMLSIVLAEHFLYCIVMCIVHAAAPQTAEFALYMSFGGYVALYTAFTSWAEYLDTCRESNTFDIVSNGKAHCVLEKKIVALRTFKNMGVKRKDYVYSIRRAKYASGYFSRMSESKSSSVKIVLNVGVIPFLAITACIIVSIIRDSFALGVNAAGFVFFAAAPLSALIVPAAIEYIHSLELKKSESAFVGCESVSEYSNVDSVMFDDTDAVEITALTEINPNKSDESSKKWLNISRRIFEMLGGPMSGAIRSQRADGANISHDLVINSISENGIDVYFDSSMNVLIGDRQYMLSHNIKVKTDTNLTTAVKGTNKTVVYLAFDGVPRLGFILTSNIKKSFLDTVNLLKQHQIKAMVESYEPQINEYYFEANQAENILNVHKPELYEQNSELIMADSGIIASTPHDLCKTILYGREIAKDRKKIKLYRILQLAAGFAISALIVLAFCKAPSSRFMDFIQRNSMVIFYLAALLGTTPNIVRIVQLLKKK